MTVIKPRDEQGKIVTNISHQQFVTAVKPLVDWWETVGIHQWECWNCGEIYDAEPPEANGNLVNCPNCNAEIAPF